MWYFNSVVDGYRQMFCIFNLKAFRVRTSFIITFVSFVLLRNFTLSSIFTLKWGKLWAWTFLRMSVWFCYSVRLICTMPSVTNLLAILIFLMLVISTSPIWRNLAHMLTKSISFMMSAGFFCGTGMRTPDQGYWWWKSSCWWSVIVFARLNFEILIIVLFVWHSSRRALFDGEKQTARWFFLSVHL